MNNKRRDKIRKIFDELTALQAEEQEYYENMPAGFQDGDKGEKSMEAIENMQEAMDALERVIQE